MAAEPGHAPNRAYFAQDGSIHLNGAALYDANENDVSASLRHAGGTVVNSSSGLTDVLTGLTGIIGASASILSTAAPTTAAGVPQQCSVGYSTASGTLQILALKYGSTANTQLAAATSTGFSLGWVAFGF